MSEKSVILYRILTSSAACAIDSLYPLELSALFCEVVENHVFFVHISSFLLKYIPSINYRFQVIV